MELLERHSGDNAYVTLLDCADCSLNFSDISFGYRGVHNDIDVTLGNQSTCSI